MLETFNLLVIFHFIGDFILQGPKISANKRGVNKYMLIHGIVMGVFFFLPLINYPAGKTLAGVLLVFVTHMIVDAIRVEVMRFLKLDASRYFFWVLLAIDQSTHVTILYLIFARII